MLTLYLPARTDHRARVSMHKIYGAAFLRRTKRLVIDYVPVLQRAIDEQPCLRQLCCLVRTEFAIGQAPAARAARTRASVSSMTLATMWSTRAS